MWMEHTDRLAHRLSGITNGKLAALVDDLFCQYMADWDSDPLETKMVRLTAAYIHILQWICTS